MSGSQWIVTNNTATTESIPAYAIVLTVIFVWLCLLGLLFLLIKERKTTGFVQVTVHGPGFHHATQVPIGDLAQLQDIESRVSYIRSLVAALPPQPPSS